MKILVCRFSSIGDIILTSPVLRCLATQTNADVHFLTKKKYACIIEDNPHISKLFLFEKNFFSLVKLLRQEDYDYVIDLHKNVRTFFLKLLLGVKSSSYYKANIEKFLLINFGVNVIKKKHVVDAYFESTNKLGVQNDHSGLDYFISPRTSLAYVSKKPFVVWCIGGSNENKKNSYEQIVKVCDKISLRVLLLGDQNDRCLGSSVVKKSIKKNVLNFCGKLSLDESALLIKESCFVLSGDNGLMHIASAFNKPIASFWGCTQPILGFEPYMPNKNSKKITTEPQIKPCSRHGAYCRKTKTGCVKEISPEKILAALPDLLF